MREKSLKAAHAREDSPKNKGQTVPKHCQIHEVENQIYSNTLWAKVWNAELNSQQKIHVNSHCTGKIQRPERVDTEKQILIK